MGSSLSFMKTLLGKKHYPEPADTCSSSGFCRKMNSSSISYLDHVMETSRSRSYDELTAIESQNGSSTPRSQSGNGVRGMPVRRTRGPGRKPKACTECKKQKMKCVFAAGDKKCRHCLRRSVECTLRPPAVQKSSYTYSTPHRDILYGEAASSPTDGYVRKIATMESDIINMKRELDQLRSQNQALQTPSSSSLRATFSSSPLSRRTNPSQNLNSPVGTVISSSREDNTGMAMTRENSVAPDATADTATESVTVEEPMGTLYEVTRLRNLRSNQSHTARPRVEGEHNVVDFISRGVIEQSEADELYDIFHTSLNHYLWVGLEQTHSSFLSVRKSSELLTATILTVTALHVPDRGETFDKCYREFLSLISSSMFSRYHSVDDVRGLCIAAFWLSEVSWKLSGHAIRIATELNIHQSFAKALEGDREHFLRARLWYMLYVCDHHFSIAYGRPPMIADSQQIREHETFLASPLANALDVRILSQVALMRTLTQVYDRFAERRLPDMGSAVNSSGNGTTANTASSSWTNMLVEGQDFEDIRRFNLEIDQWRMTWHVKQRHNEYIGAFPPQGIILYSYFAKLQLNSLALRGISLSQAHLSTERKEFANMAISAATSILTFVLEEEDLRRALVGTPLYVHTMIAFASVFLMKVATKWNRIMGLNVESGYVFNLQKRMIELLRNSVTSDRHLLHHIAAGLEQMLHKLSKTSPASASSLQTNSEQSAINTLVDFAAQSQQNAHQPSSNVYQNKEMPGADYHSIGEGFSHGSSEFDQHGLFNSMPIMNNDLIYEAFGTDSANDVYNLLSSQFSY